MKTVRPGRGGDLSSLRHASHRGDDWVHDSGRSAAKPTSAPSLQKPIQDVPGMVPLPTGSRDHRKRFGRQRIAKVEEEVEVPDAKEAVYHTVVKGDNLWKIAEKYLGNGARNKEIFEANRPMLKDPDKIYPGQVLRIPAK